MRGNESPPQAPKFLENNVSKGRNLRENYIQYEFLPPKAAKDLQLSPLVLKKKCLEGPMHQNRMELGTITAT